MKDVTSEADSLLGTSVPEDVVNYEPKESAAAKVLLKETPFDEDSEREEAKQRGKNKPSAPIIASGKEVTGPDYEKILLRMRTKGETFYAVHNESNIPLFADWDMNLLPEDLHKEFDIYLAQKYTQYNIQSLAGRRQVAVLIEGNRTVSFIDNFALEKGIPVMLPVEMGKETTVKSRFAIPAGDAVICTAKQLESLEKFEAIKHEFPKEGGGTMTSDYTGFLVFEEITKTNLRNFDRSYISYQDALNSRVPTDFGSVIKSERVVRSNVIKKRLGQK